MTGCPRKVSDLVEGHEGDRGVAPRADEFHRGRDGGTPLGDLHIKMEGFSQTLMTTPSPPQLECL